MEHTSAECHGSLDHRVGIARTRHSKFNPVRMSSSNALHSGRSSSNYAL